MTPTTIRVIVSATFVLSAVLAAPKDPRNIATGNEIPTEHYADQPYVVVLPDDQWFCVLTTGSGREGAKGQYIISTTSADRGRTWTKPVRIEEPGGPEASWAMPLLTDFGRIYVFYDFNGEHVGTERAATPELRKVRRADMLGWYCYKYTDDFGTTWSNERYRLPVRVTNADRQNSFGGTAQILWGVGKPIRHRGYALLAFTKIKTYLVSDTEGWLFRSDNILIERDPKKIRWVMLPEGENPIRRDGYGPIQEEQNCVPLSGSSLACMYRTVRGHPAITYSRDNGTTWSRPEYARYRPGGRMIKHPRACPRIWRTKNGKYLFWFHNHGGKSFADRNPAWIVGGVERDGVLHWSEPEILLYLDNPTQRTSYPDLIEQDGRWWITETQKEVARVHSIDPALFEGLWEQLEEKPPAGPVTAGRIAAFGPTDFKRKNALAIPRPLSVEHERGFTLELWLTVKRFKPHKPFLDTTTEDGPGWRITLEAGNTARVSLLDGRSAGSWGSDPGLLQENRLHHLVFIVDGGPNIITVIVDGRVCDGGSVRQYGWGRLDPQLGDVSGRSAITADLTDVTVHALRVYDRYLRTAEVLRSFRAGTSR